LRHLSVKKLLDFSKSKAMPKDEAADFSVTAKQTVFEGRVWNVVSETFDYNGQALTRDFVAHTGAVAVAALNDLGELFLIRQYRHPVRKFLWELPAGLTDVPGESNLDAAKRELAEEAGLQADTWHSLQTFHTTPGGSDESIEIFLATGLSSAQTDFVREGEESDMQSRWVGLDEARESVLNSDIQNPAAVVAILALTNRLK
jgi:8-oxo-dGTP pyrophosphatase MutT (NUDIX family)